MYRSQIEQLKFLLVTGRITYDEAKEMAEPIIEKMNERGKEIAKKHNQKFRPFTFTGLMR